MPFKEHVQFVFQGMDAISPEHAVPDNYAVTATNIDFGLEPNAATVRRGSLLEVSVGSSPVTQVWRRYVSPIGSSPFYMQVGSNVVRVVGTGVTVLSSGGVTGRMGVTAYRDNAYIGLDLGPNSLKDTGTSSSLWVKPGSTTAPSVTPQSLSPLVVVSTYSISEGTSGGGSGGTATGTTNSATGRLQFNGTLTATNLDSNGGNKIGDYGIDYITLRFSDPGRVRRVSKDYSIGDTSFTNYYHAEMDVMLSEEALPDSDDLIDSLLTRGTDTTGGVDEDTRAAMAAWVRTALRAPRSRISAAKDSDNVWAVPRTKFEFVGPSPSPSGWSDIRACRIVVEAYGSVTVVVKNWEIRGAESYPLNDADVGYSYWETYAKVDGLGLVSDESPPSPPSPRTRMQHSRAVVVLGAPPSDPDYNKRVIWRQGGYLRSPYPVGTIGIGTSTFTDTLSDMAVLSNRREMPVDLLTNAEFPNNIVTCSEPFHDRIFIGYENRIRWSLPGNPSSWPRFSEAVVSHKDDKIQKILVWGRLVIVNRDSVYEMDGSVFEGVNQDWVLQRSGARRGSFAPNTIIKTPHGVLLLDWDGIYMYMPGQGVDVEVSWANALLADAFKGQGSNDPAALKGNRIPAVNLSYLHNSSAAWANEKLYLAMPAGSEQFPTYVYVLDFSTKRAWWYKYPFSIASLFWDRENNRLLAGTTDGKVMRLEVSTMDQNTGGTPVGIGWSLRTRQWTSPADTVHENLAVEHNVVGGTAQAVYDSTSTIGLGTMSSTNRTWLIPPLSGTTARSVQYVFSGTATGTTEQSVRSVVWDALVEPPRVQYFKTDYFDNGYPGEKYWDAWFPSLEIVDSGTVLATAFIDGTAVSTATFTGPTNSRRNYTQSFPVETYGNVSHVVYVGQGSTRFKHWETSWSARNEPPRVNMFKTDPQSLDENIVDAFDVDINPNGTVYGTVYVDNVPLATGTFAGYNRQSYTKALPNYTYGRTLHVVYTGQGFKHYNTWYHLRPEPDRWTNYVSDKVVGDEKEWRTFEYDIDVLSGVCTARVFVDGTIVSTETITGPGRKSGVKALPAATFGRTIWADYTCTGLAKHYRTWFDGTDEPDRITVYRFGPVPLPSNNSLHTWIATLDPLGGSVTGVLLANGTAVSTAVFTGNTGRKTFPVGIEYTGSTINEASQLEVLYTSSTPFKHYDTKFETIPKPFGKKTWLFRYQKIGGASQLNVGRFWSLDVEAVGTATITCTWEIDGKEYQVDTVVASGRTWLDRIPFTPGARGRLFQLRLISSTNFEVFRVNIDTIPVGIKGLGRVTYSGTPMEQVIYSP